MNRKFLMLVVAAALALGARAVSAFSLLGGVIVNNNYSANQVVSIPLGGISQSVVVVATYSSATYAAATFTTGQVSTGSVTIADNTKLSKAAATESIVVNSTSGAVGDFVSMSCPILPGAAIVRVSRDWIYGANVNAAATNLAASLTKRGGCLGGVTFGATGNVVYATAPVGGLYNKISVVTNDPTTLTVANPTFTGGRDAAVVNVNGTPFQAGLQYAIGVSAGASATNLAAAINARAPLNKWVTALAVSSAVNLTNKVPGAFYNFPLTTSNSAAVSVFAPKMYGGVNPSWSLNSPLIAVPNHRLSLGLAVLYNQGTSPAIGGLTTQTTYYVIPVDTNNLELASSAANAVLGTHITLTSTSTLTAQKTYTLTPLAWAAGSGQIQWQVSNDGSSWVNLSASPATFTAGGTTTWDLGALNFNYLGLNVTAPTTGGESIYVTAKGSQF